MNIAAILQLLGQLSQAATGHQWGLVMVIVSGWLVQLFTEDSRFPISIPASWGWSTDVWKPVAVVVTSVLQTELVAIFVDHTPVLVAVLTGLKTAMWTMGLWSLVIKAICGGKVPKWLNYLALVFPTPQTDPAVSRITSLPPPRRE